MVNTDRLRVTFNDHPVARSRRIRIFSEKGEVGRGVVETPVGLLAQI